MTGILEDTLPLITISAGTGNGAYLSFPALTSWTIQADTGAGGDNSFPALTSWTIQADTGAGGDNSFPALVLDAAGVPDMGGSSDVPALSVEATGVTGSVSSAANTLPLLVLDAASSGYALLEIPVTLDAYAVAGNTANAAIQLPAATIQAIFRAENLATGGAIFPPLSLSATGLAENDSSFSATFPLLQLVTSGLAGRVGESSLVLPALVLSAQAFSENTGAANGVLPMWELDAAAFSAIAEAYRAWALNVRSSALTEYTGVPFNSAGTFHGKVLVAGPSGVHILGENNSDDGVAIDAAAKTAIVDFNTTFTKRVPRIYAGYKAEKDMEFRTITTQDGPRAYLLPRNGNEEVQQRRVPINRGPKSRFWQFEIANREGGDFTVVDVLVRPELIKRRVV